jgi:hypothetical protein
LCLVILAFLAMSPVAASPAAASPAAPPAGTPSVPAAPAVAKAAPPAYVNVAAGSTELDGVSCPTATTCVAVGNNFAHQGVFTTVTKGVPGPVQVVTAAQFLWGIACTSLAHCLAVGYSASAAAGVVVPISNGVVGTAVDYPIGLLGVACPDATNCMAVGWSSLDQGVVVPIIAGVPAAAQVVANVQKLTGVACPTAVTCEAVGTGYGDVMEGAVVAITAGVAGPAQLVRYTAELSGVGCASATHCVAGGDNAGLLGVEVPVDDGVAGAPVVVPGTDFVRGVACSAPARCQLVGSQFGGMEHGVAAVVANGTPSTAVPVRTTVYLTGVACPSTTFCQAVAIDPENIPMQGVAVSIDPAGIIGPALFTNPQDQTPDADTTMPFRWSPIPEAQAYYVLVGTTVNAFDLVNSGPIPASQSGYLLPDALPTERTLYATLLVNVGGIWYLHDAISFIALPGKATFTYPRDGQTNVDTTKQFTWATIPQSPAYYLTIGTTPFGDDLLNSGWLVPGFSFDTVPALPTGRKLYATVYTLVYPASVRYSAITFTVATSGAILSRPVNGQRVATPSLFTWPPAAGAESYLLVVGTSRTKTDVFDSGLLGRSATSAAVPALPRGQTLYASLLTKVNGVWTGETVTFNSA